MARFKTLNSEEIAQTLQNGRLYRSRSFLVFFAPIREVSDNNEILIDENLSLGKIAFIAPKKIGNAVLRNRCKRVLRAGFLNILDSEDIRDIYDKNNIILMSNMKTYRSTSIDVSDELISAFNKYADYKLGRVNARKC